MPAILAMLAEKCRAESLQSQAWPARTNMARSYRWLAYTGRGLSF